MTIQLNEILKKFKRNVLKSAGCCEISNKMLTFIS